MAEEHTGFGGTMPRCGSRASRGLTVAALVGAASASALPPGVAIREIGFEMKNLELPSGMRIVIEEDHSQPLVAIVSVVDVGSAKDPEGKEGLAHLVEHLAFRARPDGKLPLSSLLGFAAAGYWNAFTGHDLTTYVTVGPREALPQLLALEGKRLLSTLAGVDARTFDVERGVVRNELAQRDEQGVVSAVDARLYGTLYPKGHPYHRSVEGTEASLSSLTLADAQSFVQQHYVPRNITLFVSGDLDLATIVKVFDASFPHEFLDAPASGPVAPAHRLAQTSSLTPVPTPAPSGRLETIRAPADRPVLYIAWSLPGGFGPQRYLERFARSVFSGASAAAATPGSNIAGVDTSLYEGRYGNTLVCSVSLKEGKEPEKALERVLDQVVRIWASSGGTRAVVAASLGFDRLQKMALVGMALKAESVRERAVDKATLIHWTGDPLAWGKDMQGLRDLSRSKVEAFAYEWLTRDRARAIYVEPTGERPFESAGTPAVFAASDDVHVSIAPEALSTYVHGPANSVHSFLLKNGLEVLFVQRTSAPTVAVTLGLRGGRATSEPLGVAELAAVLAAPTKDYNGPPSKYGVRLSLSPSDDTMYLAGQAASGNLENVLAMMSDRVKSLHVDGGREFAWDELVKSYRRMDAVPSVQAQRTLVQQTFLGSPLGRVAVATDIERLGPNDLQTWIDRTFHPRGAVLAVVGDINFVEAEKEVRDWLEGWQGDRDPRGEAPPSKVREQEGPVRVVRIDRAGVKQTDIRLGCAVATQNEADRIALRLLASRIRGRLWSLARSSLGGSYGFSASTTSHLQESGLEVEGRVDDRVLTRVLAVARSELDGLSTLKPGPEELGLLKWRQGVNSNLAFTTNAELARGLVSTRLAGLPVEFITKYPELLAALTAEDVARVAASCRKTAVLLLTGDPAVVGNALQSTAH